jgi:hypothetical protein
MKLLTVVVMPVVEHQVRSAHHIREAPRTSKVIHARNGLSASALTPLCLSSDSAGQPQSRTLPGRHGDIAGGQKR